MSLCLGTGFRLAYECLVIWMTLDDCVVIYKVAMVASLD